MPPLFHIILSTIIAAILYPFYGIWVLAAYISGVLVDVDHLIEYFKTEKALSFKKLKHYYKTTDFDNIFQPFHSVEFLIILIILSFYHEVFIVLAVSYSFHYAVDFIFQINNDFLHHRNFSFFYWIYQKSVK